jgi:hypothetical protein
MAASRGKRVAWITGLGVLATLVAAVAIHGDPLRRYRVWALERRLAADPAVMWEIAERPEGSVEEEVLERFLETPAGQREFLERVVAGSGVLQMIGWKELLEESAPPPNAAFVIDAFDDGLYVSPVWRPDGQQLGGVYLVGPSGGVDLVRVARLALGKRIAGVTLARYPELVFSTQHVESLQGEDWSEAVVIRRRQTGP